MTPGSSGRLTIEWLWEKQPRPERAAATRSNLTFERSMAPVERMSGSASLQSGAGIRNIRLCPGPIGWLLRNSEQSRVSVLGIPAAAKVPVNPDQSKEFVQLSLGQAEFGIEGIGFVGQHLQVAGRSAAITDIGKSSRIACRHH